MKYINLQNILQQEQNYILDYSKEFGKEIQAVKHDQITSTCFEKASILGWNPKQVIKSVFLYNNKGKFYGFIAPELGEKGNPLRFDNQLIKKMFEGNRKKAKSLMNLRNKSFPIDMENGTCTPFIPEHYFDLGGDGFTGTLDKIYVYDSPKLNRKKVDISIGGYGEEAHKTSVHLDYEDIYECLNWKFPGKIEKFNL
jgi:prolyl-tRNA editing enzyme YbaK/EbsC (Cys-tRNA(Pro) deacylase)